MVVVYVKPQGGPGCRHTVWAVKRWCTGTERGQTLIRPLVWLTTFTLVTHHLDSLCFDRWQSASIPLLSSLSAWLEDKSASILCSVLFSLPSGVARSSRQSPYRVSTKAAGTALSQLRVVAEPVATNRSRSRLSLRPAFWYRINPNSTLQGCPSTVPNYPVAKCPPQVETCSRSGWKHRDAPGVPGSRALQAGECSSQVSNVCVSGMRSIRLRLRGRNVYRDCRRDCRQA